MPSHRVQWAIVGLILVLIGLNSGAQYFLGGEKQHMTNLFSEIEASPQATQNSSGLKWCPVLLNKECCFNPICKKKRREACRWTDYLKPDNTNTKGWSVQKQNFKDYIWFVPTAFELFKLQNIFGWFSEDDLQNTRPEADL